MLTRNALLAAAALLAAGCNSTHSIDFTRDGVDLAEQSVDSEGKVVYRLYPGTNGAPKIHRTETQKVDRVRFDVTVRTINQDQAKRLALPAWSGVYVESVGAKSNAAKAGLAEGDVIAAVNGAPMSNAEQFAESIVPSLAPGQPVTLRVLRRSGTEPAAPLAERTVTFTPDVSEETVSNTEAIPLEFSKVVMNQTGVQFAEVPDELARQIYQTSGPRSIVAGTLRGSPGYFAGLRGGDLVLNCGSEANPPLRDLVATASSSDDLDLRVDGPYGPHQATVDVVGDVNRSTNFHFPILFDYEASIERTEWSFLDFIFQFGATYWQNYEPMRGRTPESTWKLSLFPLGMFEFEGGPTYNQYTFFWLIDWETRS